MKTDHLFTAFLAFMLPIASLCKEHRVVDVSNLRKKAEDISHKLKNESKALDLYKVVLPTEKQGFITDIAASLCDDSPPDGFEMTKAEISSQMGEGRLLSSFYCSPESSALVLNAATTILTEVSTGAPMTDSFLKEDEEPFPLFAVIGCAKVVVSAGTMIAVYIRTSNY